MKNPKQWNIMKNKTFVIQQWHLKELGQLYVSKIAKLAAILQILILFIWMTRVSLKGLAQKHKLVQINKQTRTYKASKATNKMTIDLFINN